MQDVLEGLYAVVEQRKAEPQEGSYTCYLLDKGLDKILKKCGEECSEVIIAAKNGVQEETVGEICDLPAILATAGFTRPLLARFCKDSRLNIRCTLLA